MKESTNKKAVHNQVINILKEISSFIASQTDFVYLQLFCKFFSSLLEKAMHEDQTTMTEKLNQFGLLGDKPVEKIQANDPILNPKNCK